MKKLILLDYISLFLIIVSVIIFLMSASRPIYLLAIVFINIPIFIKDKVHESLYKVIQIICSIIAIVIIGYGFYITNN
jgi:hypothetical protein